MNKPLKKSLLLLSFFALFFNCEKEDDFVIEQNSIEASSSLKPHIVYKDEMNKNYSLTESIKRVKAIECGEPKKGENTTSNKLIFNETLNISIDDESAIYMESEDGNYHSYTFQAMDYEHPYGVQNIVLSLLADGTYEEILIRYEVEGQEEIAFRNGEIINLDNKVSYALLEKGSFANNALSKVTSSACVDVSYDTGTRCSSNQSHSWVQRQSCLIFTNPENNPGQSPPTPGTGDITSIVIDPNCAQGDNSNNGGGLGDNNTDPTGDLPGDDDTSASGPGPGQTTTTTLPYVSPAEKTRRKEFRQVSLPDVLEIWFNNQSADFQVEIYNLLENSIANDDNDITFTYPEHAVNEAKMTVHLEYVNDPTDPKWIAATGMVNNNPAFEYIAYVDDQWGGTLFRLSKNGTATGETLLVAPQSRALNEYQSGQVNFSTEPNLGNQEYYYLHNPEDDRWYEYGLPVTVEPDCLSCALNSFFEAVAVNSLLIPARYFLPVEDIVILITGEDLEGVESSQALAGGFLLVDIIPGAKVVKLIKAVKYGDEVIEVAQAVVKYVDNVYKQQKELVEKVLEGVEQLTNNIRRGNFGEIIVDVDIYEKGYEVLNRADVVDLNDTGIVSNGIDHIVQNPTTGEYILIETKYNTATLSSSTNYGSQMSEEWITHHLTNNPDLTELGQDILLEGYTSVLAHVAPDGTITYTLLDAAGIKIPNSTWNP